MLEALVLEPFLEHLNSNGKELVPNLVPRFVELFFCHVILVCIKIERELALFVIDVKINFNILLLLGNALVKAIVKELWIDNDPFLETKVAKVSVDIHFEIVLVFHFKFSIQIG